MKNGGRDLRYGIAEKDSPSWSWSKDCSSNFDKFVPRQPVGKKKELLVVDFHLQRGKDGEEWDGYNIVELLIDCF